MPERYYRINFLSENNNPLQKALYCMKYADTRRMDSHYMSYDIHYNMLYLQDCFAKIKNKNCFAPDVFAQHFDVFPNDTQWTDLLINANLYEDGYKKSMSIAGCLYWKQLYYTQYCGIMELDDCQ